MRPIKIIGGGIDAPSDELENRRYLQAELGRLVEQARAAGWTGAAIDGYDRYDGCVALNIVEGEGWPDLESLRAFHEGNKGAAPLLSRPAPELEQGSMF